MNSVLLVPPTLRLAWGDLNENDSRKMELVLNYVFFQSQQSIFKENDMKLRVLVAVALSGMIASSIGFAAPEAEMSDDMNAATTQSAPATDNNTGMGSMQNNDMNQSPAPMGSSPTTTDGSNMNDDMSADTATGDDDY